MAQGDLYTGYDGTKQTPKAPTQPTTGTDYANVANPYSTSYAKRSEWDAFVESLGFTSPYQKYEMERKRNEELWNSSQQELIRQEKYNSALEQVERQRAAGLNPDLNGNVTAGDASEQTPLPIGAEHDAIQNMNQGLSTAANIVIQGVKGITDITASCITGAISIAQKFEDIAGTKIKNSENVTNVVKNWVDSLDTFGIDLDNIKKDAEGNFDFDLLDPAVKTDFNELLKTFPRRYRKHAKEYMARYMNSLVHIATRGENAEKALEGLVKDKSVQNAVGDVTYNPVLQTFQSLNPFLNHAINAQTGMYNLLYDMNLQKFVNEKGELDNKELELYIDKVNKKVTKLRKDYSEQALEDIETLSSSSHWWERLEGFVLKAIWAGGSKVGEIMDHEVNKATKVISAVK